MMDYSVAPLLCKVLVIGNSGVGKTAFLFRYFKDTFDSVYESTIGIDFHSKVVSTKNGQRVKLQVWDTAGQERYRAITAAYYRGAVAFILMFDLTNKATFEACKNW
jgi:small GTP-binding protein